MTDPKNRDETPEGGVEPSLSTNPLSQSRRGYMDAAFSDIADTLDHSSGESANWLDSTMKKRGL